MQFISAADDLFGPITTIQEGRVTKHIKWTAFQLNDADWKRVEDARAILKARVCNYHTNTLILLLAGLTQGPTPFLITDSPNSLACITNRRGAPDSLGKETR